MMKPRAIPSPLGGEGKGEGRRSAWATLTPTLSLKVRGR